MEKQIKKEKKSPFRIVKKAVIIVFCIVTIAMNVVNYVQSSTYKGLGTVYEWSSEAENASSSEENSASNKEDEVRNEPAEIGDFEQINLNTATSEELQTISGIGPAKASAILEYREKYGSFVALEEIMEVPGIGPGIYDKIKDFITVE